MSSLAPEDLKIIQEELGQSGTTPDAASSTAKQTTEDASSGKSSGTTTTKSPVEASAQSEKSEKIEKIEKSDKAEVKTSASEGEKTPSETVPPVRKKTSNYVPYERFKEVNEALKKAQEELKKYHSTSKPNSLNELDEFGQPVNDVKQVIQEQVVNTVKEVLEPIITTLDEQREQEELNQALEKYPAAQKYLSEIKAYADATNLTYEDIVTLVLAKHSPPVSSEEKKRAELEAQEAELSGKSNSTAKRSTLNMSDIKNLPTDELEKLIDQFK